MNKKTVYHAGLEGIQAAPVITRLISETGRKTIVVTAGQGSAFSFAKNLSFFVGESAEVLALPDDDPPFLKAEAKSREAETARLCAMAALTSEKAAVIVCPVTMALRDICSPRAFSEACLELWPGCEISRDSLVRGLAGLGYRRVPYTEAPGEFSARGDIVDVFPLNNEEPLRLSFFDTVIEDIRPFDPDTQKSRPVKNSNNHNNDRNHGNDHDRLYIVPAAEPPGEGRTLADWCEFFIVLDESRILSSLKLRESEAILDFEALADSGDEIEGVWDSYRGELFWTGLLERRPAHIFVPYSEEPSAAHRKGRSAAAETIVYEAKYTAAFYGQLDLFAAELKKYLRAGFAVTIIASTDDRLEMLREFTEQEGIADKIRFAIGEISAGFELVREKLVWLWDSEIFKSGKKSRRTRLKGHEKISAFTDIEKGDYIVHEKHGIGVYKGIKTIEAYGVNRDYLTLAYSGKDILYLPVEQMDRVQKYIGGGEKKPKVSKLGSDDWSRTKAKIRTEIEEYAAELLSLAAERKITPGFAFSPETVWQKDFDDLFPYDPTPDQIRCFESVRRDMENPWPMDRLICGDVGYGKTEVALRAVFKCVQDGKQAAVLVPTTILASQHFRTFSDRFADFPVRVEMLSRFNTAGEQKKIHESLADGGIDIVIGTHALISKNVRFKDLGLLIIDEEQRFGVRHKEKIRALRAGVDVLTLTATPIPRTLNMSLLGIKDMELIEDPPEDRYPVRTFVSEERPDIISESIRRELDRGGQVYVVFNRVQGIERISEQLHMLVPQARIGVCHAKMNERMIEAVMLDFYENEYDVLLSTTIIESGLDIPNVNTIVILDADRLGLTQLYQLRGRVGRTNRIAFAYLMYRRDKVLTETAEKRLRTIREFTEFGSGFKIAMKDLELRGAGNLLGLSQHGHMASVGYEMYCKMIDEAVSRLAGRAPAYAESDAECRIELQESAVIPPGYIEDEIVKLQVYKRISLVNDKESRDMVLDELKDRFGPAPVSVMSLINVSWMRFLGEKAGLAEVKLKGKRAYLVYREAPENLVERIFKASESANKEGAVLEVDMKTIPRLTITLPQGASDEKLTETTISILTILT